MLINYARNMAIDEVINKNYDGLVMLDEDNPPIYDNFIDVLLSHKKDIVT